jgi:preprotein translocase subunit SecG
MGILSIFLTVLIVIVSILLIIIVLIQNEDGDSMGGLFAGGGSSAFGSRAGNVLTRATSVLGGLFLVLSLALALVNRSPAGSGVEEAGREAGQTQESGDWWQGEEGAAPETPPEPAE